MKEFAFLGLFAFFVLMQIPFIFSLDSDICDDLSKSYRPDCKEVLHMGLSDHDKLFIIDYLKDSHYRSDCREILHMDLSDNDKLYLIEHLEDSYSVFDVQEYPSLFSDDIQEPITDYSYYDPKENLKGKFWLIFNLIVLFSLNYFLYKVLQKGSGRVKWIAE